MTYRLSIAERIALTTTITPRNQTVLQALAGAGDYTTGRNCRPNWKTLVARTGLSRASVARALAELRRDGWIELTARRHRRPTTWAIAVERLAENATQAKVVAGSACGKPAEITILGSQSETLEPVLESQSETQDRLFESQSETPPKYVRTATPSTYRDPSAPALRAPATTGGLTAAEPGGESLPPWEAFNRARHTSRAGAADVRPGDRADHDDAGDRAPRPGGDQDSTSREGLQLRQLPDPSSATGARPADPAVGPAQATLALYADVNGNVNDRPSLEQHERFMSELRARVGLERKSG